MVGLEAGPAHGGQAVRGRAPLAAVLPVGGQVRGRRVLAVDAPGIERRPGGQDLVLGGVDETHAVSAGAGEDLRAAHRRPDGDALGEGGFGRDRRRLRGPGLGRAQQRIAAGGLHGDDLRHRLDEPGVQQLLQALHEPEEQGAVAHRHEDVRRDAPQLLPDLVGEGLRALVEDRVVDVVGVVDALGRDLRAADVGAVVAAAGHDVDGGAAGPDQVDLLR